MLKPKRWNPKLQTSAVNLFCLNKSNQLKLTKYAKLSINFQTNKTELSKKEYKNFNVKVQHLKEQH